MIVAANVRVILVDRDTKDPGLSWVHAKSEKSQMHVTYLTATMYAPEEGDVLNVEVMSIE